MTDFPQIIHDWMEQQLNPMRDSMRQMQSQIADLQRRVHSQVKRGVVAEISEDFQRIKVQFGQELCSPFIPWLTLACGEVRHYRCPTIGEQVILLNTAGGDSSEQAVALVGMDSSQFPLADNDASRVTTLFGKEMSLVWDIAKGEVLIKAPQRCFVDSPLVELSGNLLVGSSEKKNKAVSEDNTEEKMPEFGNITAKGNITDRVRSMSGDREIFNTHTHKEQGDGNSVSVPEKQQSSPNKK